MQLRPQITFQEIPHSQSLENEILRRIDKLEQYYGRLMRCEVVIKRVQRHKHQGQLFHTTISLTVPGDSINVSKNSSHENAYLSVRNAFNAAYRQLKSYARKKRGQIKHHETDRTGQIAKVFLEEGFGFIDADGAEFYFSSLAVNNTEFDRLRTGMRVRFQESINGKSPQAHHINLIKDTG